MSDIEPTGGVVVRVVNSFDPPRQRQVEQLVAPLTVRGWMMAQGLDDFPGPTLCLFNGAPLRRDRWTETVIAAGDVCAFVALPRGGGGGGKNPLRTVLMIAVMIAAPYLSEFVISSMGLPSTAVAVATTALTAVITIAGMALVNALIPLPKPKLANWGGNDLPGASPTYSISGQGNSERPGAPIPVQYGRHRVFPNLIATPWIEFIGGEQYLYQAHCLGLGEYEIEALRIAETSIESFEEITYQVVEPGGEASLFDVNVITRLEVSGQEMLAPNARQSGDDGWLGPFVLNPVDTMARRVGIDVIMGRGLYYASDGGGLSARTVNWEIQAQALDDDDQPMGEWTVLASESHSAATTTPVRLSFTYPLPAAGRYQVRARRLDSKDTSARAGHEIAWGGLRAYVDGPTQFPGITLLLVKMRATNNLSQRTSRAINVVQTRKLPVWHNGAWSAPQPTRSLVWACADICRAAYGGGLPDNRLPLDEYAALDALLSARGDTLDGVFDSKTTVWQALVQAARAGRTVPVQQGGLIRLLRPASNSLPVALFGPRNIVRGSFKIQYLLPSQDTADAVEVEFFNERTWKPSTLVAKLPDSAAEAPARVALFGVTGRAQAEREGEAIAASNRYHRRLVTFQTETEGQIPTYGDLIAVTHDLPRWGQGGEIEDWDPEGLVLTLSEPPEWTEDATHYIALRRRDGAPGAALPCWPAAGENQVRLDAPPPLEPYVGEAEERTYYAFGPGQAWAQPCRVLGIRPRQGGEQVEITAVAEDARAHPN